MESHKSCIYDFNFGAKMQGMLKNAGFEIIYFDSDVTDPELNFTGAASQGVIENWSARLNRMKALRYKLGSEYPNFCNEMLSNIRYDGHEKQGNVRFVVAKKSNKSMQPTAKASVD